jgi:hypothetical protein
MADGDATRIKTKLQLTENKHDNDAIFEIKPFF